jgi:3'-phosphoadenosine 5'-phosphosulfate sulfotransferase (PAPS reductase)/FAD synthetase
MTKEDLKIMQGWPLERKIQATQTRIMEWYIKHNGMVTISFSGGADSCCLLDLTRRCYPDVEAVYANTTLELPAIRKFVLSHENVTTVKPLKRFDEVVKEYGWPFPSKEVSMTLYYARRGSKWAHDRLNGFNKDGSPSPYRQSRYGRWKYLLDSGFLFSHRCCEFTKEKPLDNYAKASGKVPIIGTLAEESRRREESWLRVGCNAFDKKKPSSQPLSFWTKSDIFRYLQEFSVPYCKEVYGDIIQKPNGRFSCTGASRSGCACCPIGCHLDAENNFQRLAVTHPKLYDYCIHTLGLAELLDYIGVDYSKPNEEETKI